jgi:thiol-disulfide isomerase/thioredoxin
VAKTGKQTRRPDSRPTGAGPRRLGDNAQRSSGAQRRAAQARKSARRGSRTGWIAIGLVIVVLAVFLGVKLSSNNSSTTSGDSAGRNPALASATVRDALTTIPASTFESIGTGPNAVPFTSTSGQTPLVNHGLPSFVYVGAEYCPYCALMRWSMVAALARFGTFTGLKVTSSADTDYNIPTLSFVGSKYTSKYVSFSAYEFEDRLQKPLETVPPAVSKLVSKYGFPPFATTQQQGGIPFLDIGNKFVTSGDPSFFIPLIPFVQNGGPGLTAIAQAIHDPTSTVGDAIQAKTFIEEANFITGAICKINGSKPASVCATPMMRKTIAALDAVKTVH